LWTLWAIASAVPNPRRQDSPGLVRARSRSAALGCYPRAAFVHFLLTVIHFTVEDLSIWSDNIAWTAVA
jgi:hypothetical protein